MIHGSSGYFVERARCARRVSLVTLGLSLAGLLLLWAAFIPAFQRAVTETVRFGYEGPNQYVRRITLQQYENQTTLLSDLGNVLPRSQSKGGDPAPRAKSGEGVPVNKAPREGPGSADQDLLLRPLSRLANVPVIRSEDLVIDRLVKPEYPQALQDQNIEGKVMVQALVDTIGRIVNVQVLGSTGESEFERAAEEAVWQCRFRPYRPGGTASEVYAVFRFVFRIY